MEIIIGILLILSFFGLAFYGNLNYRNYLAYTTINW